MKNTTRLKIKKVASVGGIACGPPLAISIPFASFVHPGPFVIWGIGVVGLVFMACALVWLFIPTDEPRDTTASGPGASSTNDIHPL